MVGRQFPLFDFTAPGGHPHASIHGFVNSFPITLLQIKTANKTEMR